MAAGELALGLLALDRGLLPVARRRLREAAALLAVHGPGPDAAAGLECAIALAEVHAKLGDASAAREALGDVAALGRPGLRHLRAQAVLAEAWVEAAEGSVGAAAALARRAGLLARDSGQLAVEVAALHAAACLGDAAVSTRLVELACDVDGARAPAAAAHAAALATRDGPALDAASRQLEAMGGLLLAADAAAQAADAHDRAGRRSSAIAATARAHRLAETCGGAVTPAVHAAARPLPLTARERDIVTLAGSGLSNRAIAERLVVSVRTVEGHLYRACGKLHVTDRGALAGLLS